MKNDLEILDVREQGLKKLANDYTGLKINGIDDRDGFRKVSEARKILKSERVQIEKDAKELRESAFRFQKTVIAREKELIAIIEPTEDALYAEEVKIEREKERLKLERERIESERVQGRVNALSKFGLAIDFFQAKNISDEKFNELLTQAEIDFNQEQEKKLQEEIKRKEEAAQLEFQRIELEKQRAEHEAKRWKLAKQEQERQEAIIAQTEVIRKEREKLECERIAYEKQKAKDEADKKRLAELEQAKKEATEKAKIEAEIKSKREAEQKIENDRIAKMEADRQDALRPDKEKILSLADSIKSFKFPEVKRPESLELLGWLGSELINLSETIKKKAKNL
jgi:hypothetical protein